MLGGIGRMVRDSFMEKMAIEQNQNEVREGSKYLWGLQRGSSMTSYLAQHWVHGFWIGDRILYHANCMILTVRGGTVNNYIRATEINKDCPENYNIWTSHFLINIIFPFL